MLKGGFVGVGRMGLTHMAILNAQPNVMVAAAADKPSMISSFLNKHMKLKMFADYQSMLEQVSLDFVVISTPSDSHSEIVEAALRKNLHVFVEKPFSLNPQKGMELARIAEEKKLVNQVGYVNRFHELFIFVKRLLGKSVIGEIKHFKAEMCGGTVIRDNKTSWRSEKKKGGGCVYDYASHCVDLVIYFFGKPDQTIGNITQKIFSANVEDLVSSTFLYQRGFTGNILVTWSDASFRKPATKVEILGEKGKIVVDKYACKIYLNKDNEKYGFRKGWNILNITDMVQNVNFYVRGNEYSRQLEYFVHSIETASPDNSASFRESSMTDFVLEEIRRESTEV